MGLGPDVVHRLERFVDRPLVRCPAVDRGAKNGCAASKAVTRSVRVTVEFHETGERKWTHGCEFLLEERQVWLVLLLEMVRGDMAQRGHRNLRIVQISRPQRRIE